MNYQTKRRTVSAIQFTDPENLPEGVTKDEEYDMFCHKSNHWIWPGMWIIDGREVMTDEAFREMYEEVP